MARFRTFDEDARLSVAIAVEVAECLREAAATVRPDDDQSGPRADRLANRVILDRIRAARPDDAVLSEEEVDDPARLTARRVWIVDPLDGTREYAEGRGDWAVHIALACDGDPVAGAVALPARNRIFSTAPPVPQVGGADISARPRIIVSRTRGCAIGDGLVRALGGVRLEMGSAGAKAMAVVMGEADIYVHASGQYEWDNCAPVAVARAAGLHASRIDGGPLLYNQANPFVPDLLIARPEWASRALAQIAHMRAETHADTHREPSGEIGGADSGRALK